MSQFEDFLDLFTKSIESFETLQSNIPRLIQEITMTPAFIPELLQRIFKIFFSASNPPQKRFYALYFLLKAIEKNIMPLINKLAKTKELITEIYHVSQMDLHRTDMEFRRGIYYFSKKPSKNQSVAGINMVKLCIELILHVGETYGSSNKDHPFYSLKCLSSSLQKQGEFTSINWFLNRQYRCVPGMELYCWDFNRIFPSEALDPNSEEAYFENLIQNDAILRRGNLKRRTIHEIPENASTYVHRVHDKQKTEPALGKLRRTESICLKDLSLLDLNMNTNQNEIDSNIRQETCINLINLLGKSPHNYSDHICTKESINMEIYTNEATGSREEGKEKQDNFQNQSKDRKKKLLLRIKTRESQQIALCLEKSSEATPEGSKILDLKAEIENSLSGLSTDSSDSKISSVLEDIKRKSRKADDVEKELLKIQNSIKNSMSKKVDFSQKCTNNSARNLNVGGNLVENVRGRC